MQQNYVNSLSLTGPTSGNALRNNFITGAQSGMGVGGVQQTGSGGFRNMLVDLAQNVNTTMTQPTEMLNQAATKGTYDIHEVMLANSKAELTINIAAQFTTKIVQAYDRVTQIQV
jgi:flagellar hook-basal body complex protein FliE